MKETKSNNKTLFCVNFSKWINVLVRYSILNFITIFLLVSSFSFSSPLQKDTLVFGSDKFYPPFEYLNDDGEPEGFNIDLIREIARTMDVELKIKLGNWEQIRKELEIDGTVDISDMFYSTLRDSTVDFALPNEISFDEIYLNKKSKPIARVDDLKGKKVAVQKASVIEDFMRRNFPDIELITVETEYEALKMVSENKCDAAVVSQASGKQASKKYRVKNIVSYNHLIFPREFGFVVKEGNSELLSQISAEMAVLISNGKIDELREKWFSTKIYGIKPIFYVIGLVVILILSMIIFFLNFSLKLKLRKESDQLFYKEERWKFATESVGDGVWDWNVQTNKVYFSKQWKEMLGYNENEIDNTLDEWDKRVHPDDKEYVNNNLNKHLDELTHEYKNEYRLLCKDGTYKWILDRGKVIERNKQGKPIRIIGTHSDISERKKSEELLNESEKRFKQIMQSVNLASIILEPDGTISYCNEYLLEITSYQQNEVIGKNWFDIFIPSEISQQIKNVFRDTISNNSFVSFMENEIKTKKGELKTIAWNNVVLRNLNGNIITGVASLGEDISLRKKAEKDLALSEEKFRKAFKTNPDLITLNRFSDGTYMEVNKGFEKIMGYTQEEAIGKSSIKLNIWKNHADREKLLKKLKKNGFVENLEVEFVSKKGKIINGLMSTSMIDLNNEIAILSVTRDITERKIFETKIIENEERFRTIFEQSASGMCLTSIEGKLITVNSPLCEMLSYSKEELVGIHFNTITHPDDLMIGADAVKQMKQGKTNKVVFEKRYLKKSGEIIWVHISTALLRDEHNNPKYFITQMEDITPRIEGDLALKSSENKFKALVEQSLTGIYIFEKEKFIYVNSRFCEIFGYSENEIMTGMKPTDVISIEDRERADENVKKRLEGEVQSVHYVAKGNYKTGKPLWVEIHGTHLKIEGKDVITGTVLDITDRKIAEEEIRKLNEELEEKVKDRTKDLESKISEIQRMNNLFVDRELRMKDLKERIIELEKSLKDKTNS